MTEVYVTGMGIITALGAGTDENRKNLSAGKPGVKKARIFESKHTQTKLFGEAELTDDELIRNLSSRPGRTMSRTGLLAINAFEEAIGHAGFSPEILSDPSTAFISASTVGGMCHTDELFSDATTRGGKTSQYLETYACGAHTLAIASEYGLNGYIDTINTACSSSANAIMLGARLISSGRAERVIAGGTDALAKFTVNGFNALSILSGKHCRPFDRDRDGLNLGEGAAYLVLESGSALKNKTGLARVSGYGNANDAFHPSAISEAATGPILAMKKALKKAGLHPDEIDFINAHGTGTENNDESELRAFSKIFADIPPFISTKPYTGHTLGAAGSVEAVYSILSLLHGEIYPGLNAEKPIEPFNILPVKEYRQNQNINHVMSNSFGFAGNCTSLIFSKI